MNIFYIKFTLDGVKDIESVRAETAKKAIFKLSRFYGSGFRLITIYDKDFDELELII